MHTNSSLVALESAQFRLYWLALVITHLGVRASLSAHLWQLLELTDSPWWVGAAGLVNVATLLLLAPLGGVLADRFDRRLVLQGSQLLAIAGSLGLWLVTSLGLAEPWHVYLAVGIASAALSFDLPTRQAMVPSLVPASSLISATTLTAAVSQVAGLVGPVVGGVIIARSGSVAAVYLLDWVGRSLVIALLLGVTVRPPAFSATRPTLVSSFVQGVDFLRSRPVLWHLMLLDFATTLFGTYRGLIPVIARDFLAVGPEGYGLLTSAVSAGGLLASAVMIRLGSRATTGLVVLGATFLYGGVMLLLGQVRLFPLALAATALLGFLDSMGATIRVTIVQLETPNAIRGRVASLQGMLARGGPALGQTLAGALAVLFGVPGALVVGATVPLFLSVGLVCFGRSLRGYRPSL